MGGTKDITPAKVSDVSFGEQVEQVKTALNSRAEAKKTEREKFAAYTALCKKHDIGTPTRTMSIERHEDRIDDIRVYQKAPEPSEDVKALSHDSQYYLRSLANGHSKDIETLEQKFPGIKALMTEAKDYYDASNHIKVDEKATKAARKELSDALAQWQESVDALSDIDETINGAKEYIGVVEKVANISAIANKK